MFELLLIGDVVGLQVRFEYDIHFNLWY
jgi:hypothetical protein